MSQHYTTFCFLLWKSMTVSHFKDFPSSTPRILGPPVVTRKWISARHVEGHIISLNAHRASSIEEALWRSYNRGYTDGSSVAPPRMYFRQQWCFKESWRTAWGGGIYPVSDCVTLWECSHTCLNLKLYIFIYIYMCVCVCVYMSASVACYCLRQLNSK